jgi:hypothetical protein
VHNVPLKESCVVSIIKSIILWYSPLMLYWADLAQVYPKSGVNNTTDKKTGDDIHIGQRHAL